jgi:hypothetical protein
MLNSKNGSTLADVMTISKLRPQPQLHSAICQCQLFSTCSNELHLHPPCRFLQPLPQRGIRRHERCWRGQVRQQGSSGSGRGSIDVRSGLRRRRCDVRQLRRLQVEQHRRRRSCVSAALAA